MEDHCKLYEQPEAKGCYDLINMIAGGNYLKTYTHQEILDGNTEDLQKEAWGRIIVAYPEYKTDDTLRQSWELMHLKGVQVAMVRYRTIVCDKTQNFVQKIIGNEETQENGYIDYFAYNGGAFKVKRKSMLKPPQ